MAIDPLLLFFALGIVARLLGSDLRLPPALTETITLLLLLAIGLKGGMELRAQPLTELWAPLVAVVALGVVTTLASFRALGSLVKLDRAEAAAVAAHYGSTSIGTFAVAVALLAQRGLPHEPFLPLCVVLLEIPGILVGISLARGKGLSWSVLHETATGKSLVALLGGLAVGAAAGHEGLASVTPLFVDGFRPALSLFLLEMGIVCAARLTTLRKDGVRLALFGVAMPIVNAGFGLAAGVLLGLSVGGTALLATLAASASYIAAPAAVGQALPQVNPALALGPALGVTFPFNVLVGVPLYVTLAELVHRI